LLPADTTATIDGLYGVWPKPPTATFMNRPAPATTNVDVRAPLPGEVLPGLADALGTTEAGLYAWLEANYATPAAPAVVDWCRRSWAAMKAPPVATPATQPATQPTTQPATQPSVIELRVDGVPWVVKPS
jgi:hypothetical protein